MKCPNCKRKTDDINFCSWCGFSLLEESDAESDSLSTSTRRIIIVIAAVILIGLGAAIIVTLSMHNPSQTVKPNHVASPSISDPSISKTTQTYSETKPLAPSNLNARALSSHEVQLNWFDNSSNEKGFRVYRDYEVIANLPSGTTSYRDSNLDYSSTYTYVIAAFNNVGESRIGPYNVKTLNPSVRVVLDKIGVYFDHDPGVKGAGEIYLGVVVADENIIQEYTFPADGTYSLNDNEYISVNKTIFSIDQVGEHLTFFVTAYESDGGDGEQLLYEALGMVTSQYTAGISLGSLFSSIFGGEDDFVGGYEKVWNVKSGWGAGHYNDIRCGDLRLWYSIYTE